MHQVVGSKICIAIATALGAIASICVLSSVALELMGHSSPPGLFAIAGTAIGALALRFGQVSNATQSYGSTGASAKGVDGIGLRQVDEVTSIVQQHKLPT